MRTTRLLGRLGGLALAAGLMFGGVAAVGVTPAAADPDGTSQARDAAGAAKLGEHDQELLADALASRERQVTIMIATKQGATEGVQAEVEDLGGLVGAVNDKLGYVRATLPTAAVTKAAANRNVLAVDLKETLQLPDPSPDLVGERDDASTTVAGPGPSTPDSNPFMPTRETGAVTFKSLHPTFDGRAITIGILDSGVDLDNPALQTTSTGERKIVDWVTATDPLLEGDLSWRAMLTAVTGPTFTFAGSTWTAPAGSFRVNRFTEAVAVGEFGGDVNRDGDTVDRFGVLYDPATNDIWVDHDQDFDFTDESIMRPYREAFQVGHFGVDNPATGVAETVPFVVEFREDVDLTPAGLPGQLADFVNIGVVSAEHGSHVAGIAAGHALFGGDMDGAAPGAKIVSSRACLFSGGCTNVALVEGMADLVINRGVDVVNMSIGGLPALNDGISARTLLYNNLIKDFGVQIVISAGNSGPGINTHGDPAAAADVISAGASVSKETWLANYGAVVTANRDMFNFSSRGPLENGAFKPNLTAPGSAISTVPLWQPGQPVPEAGYSLPAGYAMLNGTSMAAPQTAGAVALLLSAAKAEGFSFTPAQLRQALYSSATYNSSVPAFAQGNGQVNVNAAWFLLDHTNIQPRTYTVDAPVCSPLSQFLSVPHRGPGIYNRCAASEGGHAPGQQKSYQVTITRTTGPAGHRLHALSLVGNDGTFSVPSVADLPLGVAKTITVKARPSVGAHSALLRVDDLLSAGIDLSIMNVVIASNDLAGPSFGFGATSSVERNRTKSFFVTVPEGAAALQVNLSGLAANSQTRWIAINPWGVPVESTSSLVCYTNFSDPADCNPTVRAYSDPIPGVWELEVESRRTTPILDNPFTLSAVTLGVAADPETIELSSVPLGVAQPLSWTITNQFGPVTVQPTGGPLGSALVQRPTIAHNEHQEFTVDVPAEATRLDVTIGNPSDLGADLDLTVFKDGVQVAQDADGDSEESVSIANPAAGQYVVDIHGFDVPAGTTEYDYRDVFFAAGLGSVTADGGPIALATGESAPVTGSVTAASTVAAGRVLFGDMTLVTAEGVVVGRSGVVILSVV